jgi:large subunit ribosomal protein L4
MKVEVLKTDGQKSGRSVELDDSIFGLEPNEHAIYLAVKQYLANQRQGTHKTLEKSEVSGSTRKLHKQKGTGGSRKGSIKAPQFYGGARVFGPRPRDYGFKLNKNQKDLAKRSALSAKAKSDAIFIVEDFKLEDHRTAGYSQILKNLGLNKTRTLFVIPENDKNVTTASRNIPDASVIRASDLNAYAVMNCRKLIVAESALTKLSASSK